MAEEKLNFCIGTISSPARHDKRRPCHHSNYAEECRLCFFRRHHEYRRIQGTCKCALPRIVEEDTNGNVESLRSSNAHRAVCVRKIIRSQILDSFRRTNTSDSSSEQAGEPYTCSPPRQRGFLRMTDMGSVILRMNARMRESRAKRDLAHQAYKLSQHLENLSVRSDSTKPADLSEQFTQLSVNGTPEVASPSSFSFSSAIPSGSSGPGPSIPQTPFTPVSSPTRLSHHSSRDSSQITRRAEIQRRELYKMHGREYKVSLRSRPGSLFADALPDSTLLPGSDSSDE